MFGFSRGRSLMFAVAAVLTSVAVAVGIAAGRGSAAAASAPQNVSLPTIAGAAFVGETLFASPGTWAGSDPISFSYSWTRCGSGGGSCSTISAATTNRHTLTRADLNHTLRVRVTAHNSDGQTTVTSDHTAVVSITRAPVNTALPTVSGSPVVGQALSAHPGEWTGNPSRFDYQWLRCDTRGLDCGLIASATSQTYTITSADTGSTARVRVTASNANGRGTATSLATPVVTRVLPSGCPAGSGPVSVNDVTPPARLVIDRMAFTPSTIPGSGGQVLARFHVSNTCSQSVSGALVYATAVPYNQLNNAPEVATDASGWATIAFHTLRGFPVSNHQQLLVLFTRARKAGENELAGISTRRLISIPTNLNI